MPTHKLSHKAHVLNSRRHSGSARVAILSPAEDASAGELLEELDEAMIQAIGGCRASLERARDLWPRVSGQLGEDMIEESREQYLRYAVEITRRFEFKEIRDPAVAITALEIIAILTRGVGAR